MAFSKHTVLTERQLNLCEYGGVFGVLLSLTCLIQHFIVIITKPITQAMIPAYVFAIIAFILLGLKKPVALVLLIISAALSMAIQLIWSKHQAISAVVLALFLYHVIILACLYAEHIPAALKKKQQLERAEQDEWAGKL